MSKERDVQNKAANKPAPKPATNVDKPLNPLTATQIQTKLDAATLTQMQQTMGNTAVQRFLAQRKSEDEDDRTVSDTTADTIQAAQGKGHQLDKAMAQRAGKTMGHDFNDVTIHTDAQSDQLSRQLGAQAFTIGSDVFFRQGKYEPSSQEGQHLIAHELTHVVQQSGAAPTVQGKLSVNDPDDQYEAEADKVADQVMQQSPETAVARQEEEEVAMAEMAEEEEVAMQEEEGELQLQEEEDLQLQEEEEGELQLQEEEDLQLQEEEELQLQEEEEEVAIE